MAAGDNLEVLLELRELRGIVTAFQQTLTSVNEAHLSQSNRLNGLENRVTALEATKKSPTSWTGVVGVILPTLALGFVVLDKMYQAKP